ncbi:TonB-dependent receptor plug domain-containing protein [Neokomagataea anthophila]|uniref:TonB-dependent receptor n=1 Tax=Neokomagataea anthophila TaxID=2826925 RepID=A0ABS5E3M4_9PROT|nr:TonB-dependent receptor [Neokomagataea anthophila]MBR0558510.1 TonB-dependent receptor [Neokomagataea anthophila]
MPATTSSKLRHRHHALLLSASVLAISATCAAAPSVAQAAAAHKHAVHTAAKKLKGRTAAPAVATPTPALPAQHNVASTRPTHFLAAPYVDHSVENVVVTGTLFRDPNATSSSEITHITRRDMQQRGLKTVNDMVQQLSSNGAGNLTSQWASGGGFAPGGSAPALRGLSTDSTLVLIDGQRNSYYPLADDGERNFVDTTWIPQSILEGMDVLQDGGSATYGADAVAGVINFNTRKQIKGFEGNAEGGLTQRGDQGHQRLYATYGHGDLNNDGYNVYVNSEYDQDDALYYRQLQSPYNNGDLTGLGGSNGNTNTLLPGTNQFNTNFTGSTQTALVRPAVNGHGVGGYNLLNPATGCGPNTTPVSGYGFSTNYPNAFTNACSQNAKQFSQISPDQRRISATAHLTANITDQSQLIGMFNWSQARTTTTGAPASYGAYTQNELVGNTPTILPWQLSNGQLNPNDPYSAQHQDAQIAGLFNQIPTTTVTSNNFRGSLRYNGWAHSNWGSNWDYNADFVGMNTLLNQVQTGQPYISHVQQVLADGSYNFVNPSQNSAAITNYVLPRNTINARSQEYSGNIGLSKGLFQLPGGMVKVAIGGNIRYESVNDPNANPTDPTNYANQWASYNPVAQVGHRWVEAGFYEANIPVVKQFNIDTSGRYDHYSEGFSHFSPKVGFQFKPVKEFTLRGTFNRGFRVPSFAETGGQTEGFTSSSYDTSNPEIKAWQASHGNSAYSQSGASIGQMNVGNPNLRPEVSTSYTVGPVFSPTNWMTLSFEYYYIKKSNFITSGILNPNQYMNSWIENGGSNAGLPAGITVVPGPKDPNYPNALPAPGYITGQYINARSMMTDGFDMSLDAHSRLPGFLHDVMWYSKGQATFVRRFNQVNPDGSMYRFAGTLGPYNAVSASGTPRWRANWANTFIYKGLSVTPTVYYTSGYKSVADDSGIASAGANGLYSHSCSNALPINQVNGVNFPATQCHVKGFWDVDMTVNYQVNKKWSVYANVYNLLGFRSPYDFGTYGGYLYNSSWSQKGVILRSFQFGVNVAL